MITSMDEHEAAVRVTGERVAAAPKHRNDHIAAVIAALKAGKRPTDVARWSPFSAAYLRKVVRLQGVPKAVKGNGHAD